MADRLRVFISSPGDVRDAREVAAQIVHRVGQDYLRYFRVEPYMWETEVMLASEHFQDAIQPPSEFDVVALIIWSRLGTPLPEETSVRRYEGIDGRAPVTGTEWEYEDALKAARVHGVPDLLVYRSSKPAVVDAWNAANRTVELEQLKALDIFWSRNFADRGMFLGAYHKFKDLVGFAAAFESHLRQLLEKRIAPLRDRPRDAEPLWSLPPFNGLQSYSFDQAPIFFGRAEATGKVIGQLVGNAEGGSAFLLVLGGSGSGKSSLVKAGVAPGLALPRRVTGASFQRRAYFRPSDRKDSEDLFDALARAVASTGRDQAPLTEIGDPVKFARNLREAPAQGHAHFETALDRVTADGVASGAMLQFEEAALLMVIDQLEELFTDSRISPDDRNRFVSLIGGLARGKRVWVLATMRSDLWHRAAEAPELVALAEGFGRFDLLPPRPSEISQMIRLPAEAAGLEFERHAASATPLNDQLAEDAAGAPGVLPLLSYVLDQLYRRDAEDAHGSLLTYATYEKLGGLRGAIASRAEEVLAEQEPEVRDALGSVLFSLVQISRDDHCAETVTARTCPLASFAADSPQRRLIDAFLDPRARLLVGDDAGGVPVVRLAHEALLTEWERARGLLKESTLLLQIRRMLEERYARWSDSRTSNGLLTGDDLADAGRLIRTHASQPPPELVDFVRRSASHAQAARRRALVIATSVAIAMAVLAGGAGWMWLRADTEVLHLRFMDHDADAVQAANAGDYDLAIATFQSNIPLGRELVGRAPSNPELQLNLAKEYGNLGYQLWTRDHDGDRQLARSQFLQAKAIADKLTATHAGASKVQAETAVIERLLPAYLKN